MKTFKMVWADQPATIMSRMIITVSSCPEPGGPAPSLLTLWRDRCTESGCVSSMRSHSSTLSSTPSSSRWGWRPSSPGRSSRAMTGRERRCWRVTLRLWIWLRVTRSRLSVSPQRVSHWCSLTGSTTVSASPASPTWPSRGLGENTRWDPAYQYCVISLFIMWLLGPSVGQVNYNSQEQLIQSPNPQTQKIPSLPIKAL